MGESQNNLLRMDFERHTNLEFHGSIVTSDAWLLAYRERDDALGLTSIAASGLQDTRPRSHTTDRPTGLAPRPAEIAATMAGVPRNSRLEMERTTRRRESKIDVLIPIVVDS
jgi:hypothetical protein